MKSQYSRILGLLVLLFCVSINIKADSLKIDDFTIKGGETQTVTVAVNHTSPTIFEYIGFQFDLFLPAGLSVTSAQLAQGLSDFTLQQRDYGNGTYKYMGFSATATPANSTDLLILTISADATAPSGNSLINLQNVIFSATTGEDIKLENSTSTADIYITTTGVSLNSNNLKMMVGQSRQLTATVSPDNATDKNVTWSSQNPGVATVGNDGTVNAVSKGTTTITATCGTVSAQCQVTVYDNTDVKVNPGSGTTNGNEADTPANNTSSGASLTGTDLTLRINQRGVISLQLPEGLEEFPTLEWSLANGGSNIVNMQSVSNTEAAFTGVAMGNTTYSVRMQGATDPIVQGNIRVIAENPMTNLSLNPAQVSVAQNADPFRITAEYTPGNADATLLTWTSSQPSVATVANDGTVTVLAQGQTTITATATDGSELSATSQVTVTKPIDENFDFDFSDAVMDEMEGITIYLGESYQFKPKVHDGYVLPDNITWSSDAAQTVSVKSDGTVTGLALGSATITASATVNGKTVTATCKVKVIPLPIESIELSANDLTLLLGSTGKLIAKVVPSNTTNPNVTWTSGSPGIASVDPDGNVTALAVGTTEVTATCGNVSATCTVTVKDGSDVTVKPGTGTTEGDDDDTPGGNTENGGSLNGSDLTLRVNQTASIEISLPTDLSVVPTLNWTLANGGAQIVRMAVDANTLSASFTGLKVGETTYSITSGSSTEVLASGKITVIAQTPLSSLELDPTSISIAKNGLPVAIKTVYTPQNASMPEFSWTSSSPTVAGVSSEGTVSPLNQGQTTITCTALDGSDLTATCLVTVTAPIDDNFEFDESVMDGVEGVTIYLGESYTLVPKAHEGYDLPQNITWSSSDATIVSVDQTGKVTGLALGTATITATATINGQEVSATCSVTVIPVVVTGIEIKPSSAEMKVTETLTLSVTITPDNTTDKTLQWTSNAPSIASVSQDGVVTARMVGDAVITARSTDGSNLAATCRIKVVPTIATGISVKAEGPTTLKAEETVKLTAIVTPETTTDKSVTWSSDKPEVATVNESGVVTGVAVGTAQITATNSAGQKASITITVDPTPVSNIELNRTTAQIKIEDKLNLSVTVRPTTATDKSVTWTSSNPKVATVDNNGTVTGISIGEAVITCSANDGSGVKAECLVTVSTTSTSGVTLTAEGPTDIKVQQTVKLKATVLPENATDKTLSWKSDRPQIATVDANGLVTGMSVGKATVTVINSGGQSASIEINVIPTQVESIKLSRTSVSLKATESITLTATILPETATNKELAWTSDNAGIAKVNSNGLVTAIATGKATITATATDGSGVKATCQVTVTDTEVAEISIIANGPTTLKAGDNVQLTATIFPETATDKSVKWTASAPEIADVNENGMVTAFAVGQSVITATSYSGLSDQLTITVEPTPVTSITLNRTSLTMKVSNRATLTATISPSTATDKSVTWASSNPQVATVDDNGNVTAILEGQASITCVANDGSGVSASCMVNVVDTDVEIVTITAEGPTTLKAGETVQLTAKVMPETSSDKSLSWSSDNEKVATVDDNGLVTAVSEGSVVIKVTTSNGISDSIIITVIETEVTMITLNESEITLLATETFNLIPTILPTTATNKELLWSAGNTDVATVNQDGLVTAVAVGETIVSASATDGSGVSATCRVIVLPTTAESIEIRVLGETTLYVNQEVQLVAEVFPATATDKSVVWSASNSKVAGVNENGLVTAYTPGESVITATNSSGQYDRVTITVLEPGESDVPDTPIIPSNPGNDPDNPGDDPDNPGNNTDRDEEDWYGNHNGTYVSAAKIREGNILGMRVNEPIGGYPDAWEYIWNFDSKEIGNGLRIETTAELNSNITPGNGKVISENSYFVTVTNYAPDDNIFFRTELETSGVSVYRRPDTPLQLLRKGNGTSHTFIAMMPISNDGELERLGYSYVFGYYDKNGTSHEIATTGQRYCHTTPEIYFNTENKFWVYTIWSYEDGSAISSGLRYLDGNADENFDASSFNNSLTTRGEVEEFIIGIYTPEGHFVGKSTEHLIPGIYVVRTNLRAYKIVK